MALAASLLGGLNVLVRQVSMEFHPFEIAFFRNLGQLLVMLVWLGFNGLSALRTKRLGMQALRAANGLVAMLCWFSALALLPVAQATALTFTAPFFATAGAALLLGETVRARRWSATAVGFLGALIILRPSAEGITAGAALALAAAAFMALSGLIIKSLSRTDSANTIAFYMALFMTPVSLGPALFVWKEPGLEAFLWMTLVVGGLGAGAQISLNRAFSAADASAVVPYQFIQLPAAALLAYVAFGEVADLQTWIGAAVIFASGVYIARREAQVAKRVLAAPAPATVIVAPEQDADPEPAESARPAGHR